jgi:ABC-2 type transport system permease protein
MIIRMLKTEIRDEILGIVREPTALFFSIVMPVGFFALFVGLFGSGGDADAIEMLATFGTFGVLAVVLMNPGMSIADARESGWLRVKRVSGTPLWVTLTAKVAAALPYAVGVLVAMTAAGVVVGSMELDVAQVARLIAVLVLGVLPFSLFSLAVGARAGTSASAAILNAILLPSAIVSGLWFPLEIMPDIVGRIARYLPTYHLAELAMSQIEGAPWAGHAGVLALTAVVGATLAGMAYRSARP